MRDAWSGADHEQHYFSEQRTCMASAIGNIFPFYFGRFLTLESTEKILSSRWESNSRPSEFYPEPKKQLDRKNFFTENLDILLSDCPLKIKCVLWKYIMWACKEETWDVLLGSVLVGLEFLPGKSNHMFESENFRFPSFYERLRKKLGKLLREWNVKN